MQQQFHNRDFWQEICPSLRPAPEQASEVTPVKTLFSEAVLSTASTSMAEHGYLALPGIFPGDQVTAVRVGVEQLTAAGIPAPFIFMFEEPWALFAGAAPLIEYFLGDRYKALPHLWAWRIAGETGNSGWPLHRDSADNSYVDHNGITQLVSLSLWLPLTDAPSDRAGMNVLPLNHQHQYPSPPSTPDDIAPAHKKALPAQAGDLLGWRQDIYHWSSPFVHPSEIARISLSLEFQNPLFDALSEPLLEPKRPPAFSERLRLLSQQFEKYRHMDGHGREDREVRR